MGGKEADATLIYLHVPKCAGSTMMGLLRANYGDGFYRAPNGGGWRKFRKLPKVRREAITCLTGHMPWGLHKWLPGPHVYATMLRHPVDRVASLYWFVRRFIRHKHRKKAQRMGLAEFAVSGAFSDLDNGMTRWLSGRRDVGSLAIKQPVTDADARLAMAHADEIAVIGFVDSFTYSVRRLADTFGWQHCAYKRKLTGRYPAPSAEERRIIEDYNRFDIMLYEYAKRIT